VLTTVCNRLSIPHPIPEIFKEYHDKPLPLDMARHTEIYFSLYFAMTGMHALHMIIGIGILGFMIYRARAGAYTSGHVTFVENFGLYWHFVDIVGFISSAALPDQQTSIRTGTREQGKPSEDKRMSEQTKHAEHEHQHRRPMVYVAILLALLVGTALTVWASFLELGPWNPIIALAIATARPRWWCCFSCT